MKQYHSKKWLYDAYWIRELSSKKIAKICNCTDWTITYWMKKFNIPRRGRIEGILVWHKNNPGMFVGKGNPGWKGGRRITGDGYIEIYNPDHPKANIRHTMPEHHLIWEKYWGEFVPNGYIVHHLDINPQNNCITNLALITKSYHMFIHVNRSRLPRVAKF